MLQYYRISFSAPGQEYDSNGHVSEDALFPSFSLLLNRFLLKCCIMLYDTKSVVKPVVIFSSRYSQHNHPIKLHFRAFPRKYPNNAHMIILKQLDTCLHW